MVPILNQDKHAATNCARCKGACCKHMPGAYSPKQFEKEDGEIDFAEIEKLLKENIATIDWWEGDIFETGKSQSFYLRAKTVGEEDQVFHGSWGESCRHLSDVGCSLPPTEKPVECLMLFSASTPSNCKAKYGKRDAVKEWYPHSDLLKLAGEVVDD